MNPYYTNLNDIISPLTALSASSVLWNTITTIVSTTSASWEESADILPTVTNYLSTNNIRTSGLTIVGNISGNNLSVSFNQGSATGDWSFAEGQVTKAFGQASHAEGYLTQALDFTSHAEGNQTIAQGSNSHAQGYITIAQGSNSHAEGYNTKSVGSQSHAEGYQSVAFGNISHAAGHKATAAHNYTYAWSDGDLSTVTQNISTTRSGQYMVSASGGVFIPGKVGIGTDNNLNALTVAGVLSTTGDSAFTGNVYVSGLANFANDVSIFRAAFGYGTNPAGLILFSDATHSSELGFLDNTDQVLATKNNGQWEYGGGSPGSATLTVSSDGASQTRFDVNSLLVVLPNLPTSSTGLPVGALWNDTGTVKIVT